MNSLAPQELSRLRRFVLGHPDRFSLAIIRAPQLDVREDLIQWTRELATEQARPFQVIPGANLSPDEIWRQLSTGSALGTIYILTGVDQHLANVDKGLARILNLQRERIAELVPGPMLLMIGELAFNHLLQDAPDFADWYAASFTFTRETTERGEMILSDSPGRKISEFSRDLIESRIALLEGQLRQPRSDLQRAKVLLELAGLHRDWVSALPGSGVSSLTAQRSLEAASAEAEQAANLFRENSGSESDLGNALFMLETMLGELGRPEEALAAAREAVDIRRQLAQSRPDAFLPDLARSLNNYGNRLSQLGRREEALAAAGEAVALYRQLVQSRPDAFLPDLASSLAALGSATEDPKSAAALFHEGAGSLLPFFLKLPQAHAPLISKLCQAYIGACKQTSAEPDPALLEQVFQVLQKMQNEAKD